MADGRTEEARVAPPAGRPAPPTGPPASASQPASGDLRAQINRAYASSAPIVEDEPDARRTAPAGPLPETAARFAAAMAAVEQQQAGHGAERGSTGVRPAPQPAPAPAPARDQRQSAGSTGVRRPRRARLRLTHVDPWSVMKTSLLLSIALGIVTVVAVSVIWAVLNASGLWDSINQTVGEVVGTDASAEFRIQDYVGTERVLGFTMLVAAVDVVLITVVATLGAFLYNLAAALLGGLEVVLAEDEL
jgi:Transmembrane domain of unknown function (DUF3566)